MIIYSRSLIYSTLNNTTHYYKLLGEKNNVILCGMPLENKTTMNIFIDNLN